MEDVKENEMQQVDAAAFLRCLDASGNSKVVVVEHLLKNTVAERGSFDYNSVDAVNSLTASGIYLHGGGIINSSGGHGILLVLNTGGPYIVQVDFTASGKIISRFSIDYASTWSLWRSITLT